mgnify:CR=1 FL=1
MNLVLQASKDVKNNTKLSSGTTSVSYAAVQYIIQNIPSYNSKNILSIFFPDKLIVMGMQKQNYCSLQSF